ASDTGDQIRKIDAMRDVFEKRSVLFVDRLPISAVHLRVVEILSLNSPRLTKYLCPLRSRIYKGFHLRDVDRSVSHLRRTIGGDYTPTISAGLIQQLLRVSRKRVRSDSLQERRGGSLFELKLLQSKSAAWSGSCHCLQIIDGARGACVEIAVVAGW